MRAIATLRPVGLTLGAICLVTIGFLISALLLVDFRNGTLSIPGIPFFDDSRGLDNAAVMIPDVFTYQQQRSLSCEYASLHIATTLLGDPVSEYAFDDVVPHNENPHLGYRGNIHGTWGNTDDYGVYAGPLALALEHFGFTGETFYGARQDLEAQLDLGRPVVVWLGMWGDTSFNAYSDDGTRYQLTAGMHVMVAYGYDDTGVYLTDPGTAVLRYYNWSTYLSMWNVMDGMALSVYK